MTSYSEQEHPRHGDGRFARKVSGEAGIELGGTHDLDGVLRVARTEEAAQRAMAEPGARNQAALAKAAADGIREVLPGARKVVFQHTTKADPGDRPQMVRIEDRSGRTLWKPSRYSYPAQGADLPTLGGHDEVAHHGQALGASLSGGNIPHEREKTWPKKAGVPTRFDTAVDLSTIDEVSRRQGGESGA